MKLWAVIPSANRRKELNNLVRQLWQDDVHPVIVDTGYLSNPLDIRAGDDFSKFCDYDCLMDHEPERNISRWWNAGLEWIASGGLDEEVPTEEYFVAVLNDDLVLPDRFVSSMAKALQETGGAVAYPDQHGWNQTLVHKQAVPISLFRRMTGYAFVLRGSLNIRADESLKWWYGDDDIDWRCRQLGGSVLVGGVSVSHLTPNQTTVGELAEQAGIDRVTFINKWGRAPW